MLVQWLVFLLLLGLLLISGVEGKQVENRLGGKDDISEQTLSIMTGLDGNDDRKKRQTRSPLTEYIQELRKIVVNLHCRQNCTEFDKNWKVDADRLFDIFKTLAPINGVRVENSVENFIKIWTECQDLVDKLFFQHILTGVLLIRPDAVNVSIPSSIQLFPELILSSVPDHTDSGPKDYQNGGPIRVMDFEYLNPLEGTAEGKLAYFREHHHLHAYHQEWHEAHRRGEVRPYEGFGYVHLQLLNRYMIERMTEGLPELEPLDFSAMSGTFWSYYPNNQFDSFSESKETCSIPSFNVQQLRNSVPSRNIARNLEEYIKNVEENVHNPGHGMIANNCRSNSRLGGFMTSSIASARDPIFYRWHLFVEQLLDISRQMEPYSESNLSPAEGIQVADVTLQSRCSQPNYVENYMDYIEFSVNLGSRIEQWITKSLKSDKFRINISLLNPQNLRKKVIIRVFLAPESTYKEGRMFIEMDRWVTTLSGSPQETIVRQSTDNSLTGQEDTATRCTWPYNLMLPKGGERRANKFRLVVFVHDPTSSIVDEGEDRRKAPFMMCPPRSGIRVNFDDRDFGFPMMRKWNGLSMEEVLDNRNPTFGNISTTVSIKFDRSKTDNCLTEPTTTTTEATTRVTTEATTRVTTEATTRVTTEEPTSPPDNTTRPPPSDPRSCCFWYDRRSRAYYDPATNLVFFNNSWRWSSPWINPEQYIWILKSGNEFYDPIQRTWGSLRN